MLDNVYFRLGLALVSAFLICFASTPLVRAFANRVGAIDMPDSTRVHDTPTPRLGGLAIFLGFLFAVVLFAEVSRPVQGMLLGAVVIVISGVIDDIAQVKWYVKIIFQIAAALIAVYHGIIVTAVSNPNVFSASELIVFGNFEIPITVLWIVGMTNAVNLIDGLDGLACGVSGISSVTMLVIALLVSEPNVAVIMAALAGACIGFLPYNLNPAKIFMGDTGALLLGYVLSTASIMGLFKFYAIISFAVPFLVLGLPLFNTTFVFFLRIIKGKNPMQRDRGHFHDRLLGMGLSQKQAVAVLYVISGILGLAAVVITTSGEMRALIVVIAVLVAWLIGMSMGAARRGNGADKKKEKSSLIEEENTTSGSGK
ncbi:MAG: undecaprenyl/decaprenyl-phosphate alpha-N-acetylglucosaminyl 1-phosphate transferase [Clostridiales bacterium]|nr:undecaprenyl/decaprenyl-phosphate alpha-N-acetylglucosaminyl 1-phosphate transferase [Clostridiales bacterium]